MSKSLGNIFRSYVIPAAIAVGTGGLSLPYQAGAQALYAGGRTATAGGNLGQTLRSGAIAGGTNYLGNSLTGTGGTTLGQATGTAANSIGGTGTASSLGSYVGNALSSIGVGTGAGSAAANILNTPISSIGTGIAANQLSSALNPQRQQANQTPAGFVPKQQDAQQLPSSLSGFGELNSDQQQSNLANQGTYGGGLGPQENSYFLNLINRQLVDKSGQINSSSNLNPISQSYLQKLGLGGYGDSNSLLEAISKWKAA
jgi:hypothetical protein